MTKPQGTLTETQLEILEALWAAGPEGLSAAGIWQAVSAKRPAARTTVLTLAARLERRGWLVRDGRGYRPAAGREETVRRLASEFTDAVFGGSASRLVTSLLGTGKLDREEIRSLRRLLDQAGERRR